MARSYRKTPIIGMTTATSEKQDKRLANRRLRCRVRRLLRQRDRLDSLLLPVLREVSNVWSFDKDGKQWMSDPSAPYYARCMRK